MFKTLLLSLVLASSAFAFAGDKCCPKTTGSKCCAAACCKDGKCTKGCCKDGKCTSGCKSCCKA
jgi:hypothetical protein